MTDVTFSSAICEAQSVYDIATRLANAPTENGADGCAAGELSRNQLLGQHAYHYCMDSDSPIAADDFAKFPGDFSAYLTAKLSDFVRIAVEDLENEANDAAHDEYPLSRADIAQLNESVALEHAVKLAKQQHAPKPNEASQPQPQESTMTRTAQDYAENYNLFAEYIDPDATTSREEFEAMTEDERLALIEAVMKANSSPSTAG